MYFYLELMSKNPVPVSDTESGIETSIENNAEKKIVLLFKVNPGLTV